MKCKKCKVCKKEFEPQRPLQMVCSPSCAAEYTREQQRKAWNKKKKELRPSVYAREYKKKLQASINKLCRMIDKKFDYRCIDCNEPFGKQVDGGHYHSQGSNHSLKYNLHNIHSQRAQPCNRYLGGKKKEYYDGLEKRYGKDYAEYVDKELPVAFPYIKLTETDVVEKLKIVNNLIKNFDTLEFVDGKEARNILNTIIGIYV